MADTPFRLYIAHGGADAHLRSNLAKDLNHIDAFRWRDITVRKSHPRGPADPIDEKVAAALRACDVLLVLATLPGDDTRWLDYETNLAAEFRVPVLGVRAGGHRAFPPDIFPRLNAVVNWDPPRIAAVIRATRWPEGLRGAMPAA
ncbi:hypothetical protein PHYC_03243 [Phycisphaerales bacterium]|nr:hypothetical protein PHYC_03243 [Phycisphaerales bacterium]